MQQLVNKMWSGAKTVHKLVTAQVSIVTFVMAFAGVILGTWVKDVIKVSSLFYS